MKFVSVQSDTRIHSHRTLAPNSSLPTNCGTFIQFERETSDVHSLNVRIIRHRGATTTANTSARWRRRHTKDRDAFNRLVDVEIAHTLDADPATIGIESESAVRYEAVRVGVGFTVIDVRCAESLTATVERDEERVRLRPRFFSCVTGMSMKQEDSARANVDRDMPQRRIECCRSPGSGVDDLVSVPVTPNCVLAREVRYERFNTGRNSFRA